MKTTFKIKYSNWPTEACFSKNSHMLSENRVTNRSFVLSSHFLFLSIIHSVIRDSDSKYHSHLLSDNRSFFHSSLSLPFILIHTCSFKHKTVEYTCTIFYQHSLLKSTLPIVNFHILSFRYFMILVLHFTFVLSLIHSFIQTFFHSFVLSFVLSFFAQPFILSIKIWGIIFLGIF